MNNYKLKKLEQEILICKKRLREIEPYIRENSAMANTYNQILVQKAILIDEYKKTVSKDNVVWGKFKKLCRNIKQEKLICDYFQG